MPSIVEAGILRNKSMVTNRPVDLKQRWTQEGRVLGRQKERDKAWQEGYTEGYLEGVAHVVTWLWEQRFEALRDPFPALIAVADLPTLYEWNLRVLDAGSIDDVFASSWMIKGVAA